ncbi:natriuretic peptides A-like [Alligator mississippiensis]|uniref:natriuretic peptides A-like n=1 Tax=Alligator mississippiensis TaxID=8496 RepID=UPI002877B89B|nr:natriuretic peptides A-like [Alligator mississippiensis]
MEAAQRCAPLLLLLLLWALVGARLLPPDGPSPSPSPELRALQALLRLLEPPDAGPGSEQEQDGADEPPDEPGPSGSPLPAAWRSLLAAPRRSRHFSGCFGTRMERIGAQSALGCQRYRARAWRRGRS